MEITTRVLFISDFYEVKEDDNSLFRLILSEGADLVLGLRNAYKISSQPSFQETGQRIDNLHKHLNKYLSKPHSVFFIPLPDLRNSLAPSLKARLLWSFQATILAPEFNWVISDIPIERLAFEKLGYRCSSRKNFQQEFEPQ